MQWTVIGTDVIFELLYCRLDLGNIKTRSDVYKLRKYSRRLLCVVENLLHCVNDTVSIFSRGLFEHL